MTKANPTAAEAKAQARNLREQLATQGTKIGHAKALELVAHQHGFRDWNTFHAQIGNRAPENWTPGGRVRGTYLSQPFEATVLTIEATRPGWFRLTLDLDHAVDVVTFESFSNFRKRISLAVGPEGLSHERTSDGVPHLMIELE